MDNSQRKPGVASLPFKLTSGKEHLKSYWKKCVIIQGSNGQERMIYIKYQHLKIHKAVTKQKGRRKKCKISENLDIFLFNNTQNR